MHSHEQSDALAHASEYNQPFACQSIANDRLLGQIIDERYVITALVKAGGMGAVYRAHHRTLGKIKAIKVLKQSALTNDSALNRFNNEAKAASSLDHPNLVAVHDFGLTADGEPYLVMDYVDGKSLCEILKDDGPLPAAQVIQVLEQLCDGMQHAHDKGIIHRDIKPSNILVCLTASGAPQVKIVDFGIAKMTSNNWSEQHITRAGEVCGSPPYMSPEQCHGDRELDARSDIYSLGCVTYEALTGVPPFLGDNAMQTMYKHINERPAKMKAPEHKLSGSEPELMDSLEKVVMRALEKDPSLRYQSMAQMRADLESIKGGGAPAVKAPVVKSASERVKFLFAPVTRKIAGQIADHRRLTAALLVCVSALLLNWWLNSSGFFIPEWRKDLSAARNLQKEKKFVEAGEFYEKAIKAVDAAGEEASNRAVPRWQCGEMLTTLPANLSNSRQTIRALHLYGEAGAQLEGLPGLTEFRAHCFQRQGDCQSRLGSYQKAIFCYSKALSLAKSAGIEAAYLRDLPRMLCGLAYAYDRAGKYKEAQTTYRQALSAAREGKRGPDNTTLICAQNLANLLRREHNYEAAEKAYSEAERLALQTKGPGDLRYGAIVIEHLQLLKSMAQSSQ